MKQKDEFSRDADQTRYIWIIGIVAVFTLFGFFAMELTAMIIFRSFHKETGIYKAFIFTSEIVHTLVPVTLGAIGTVGGFLFGKEVGKQQAQRTNGGATQ